MVANLAIEILLDLQEVLLPSLLHLVLAGEPEGEAEVLQLHEIDVARRILRDPVQHVEELLAAPRLAMQRHQQRMLRPFALIAPRRRQDRLVEAGAQRVPRGEDDLVRHAGRARLLLEPANLLERVTPKTGDVHRRRVSRIWAVRSSSGLAACTSGFRPMPSSARADCGIGSRDSLDRAPRLAARTRIDERAPACSGPRPHPRRVRPKEGIVAIRHASAPNQLRIAQNSSASPGNSPATCIATPPESLSCSHSSSV